MKKLTALFLVLAVNFFQVALAAYSPTRLYDDVWRIVENKYVDHSNIEQEWQRWRHKYDNKIQTKEDAYVAIDTMLASLNDPYTRFLPPRSFKKKTNLSKERSTVSVCKSASKIMF
jgi:carboxyl-terminal processing protease